MMEMTIRKLNNELEEKDKEMKSLRSQREDLYKALQENIKIKSTQSFGKDFEEILEKKVILP